MKSIRDTIFGAAVALGMASAAPTGAEAVSSAPNNGETPIAQPDCTDILGTEGLIITTNPNTNVVEKKEFAPLNLGNDPLNPIKGQPSGERTTTFSFNNALEIVSVEETRTGDFPPEDPRNASGNVRLAQGMLETCKLERGFTPGR